MTTTASRSSALRSLPVLLALLFAFFAAPVSSVQPAAPAGSSASHAAAMHRAAPVEASGTSVRTPAPEPVASATGRPVPDAVRALRAQLTARVSASRAPPASA
ncbi:hypothetical protein [Actinoplanes sp. GCM10030250]|uniref:hypothetical protein n=1 Tax=Actinoplanes sp. GCM10030250 TaxID=3273376 RepID=UPI003612DBA6